MLSLTRCSLLLAVCAPVWAQTLIPTLSGLPTKQFGHAKLVPSAPLGTAPNLLEGREFYNPSAVAIDTAANPPILYVADSNNHRVLAWQNPAATSAGDFATKVIGQRDMYSGFAGGPGATAPILSASGLSLPSALAVDSDGNLYVLDAGNNRILRFPKPMAQTSDVVNPDLVIGQKTAVSGNQVNEGLPTPNEKTLALRVNGTAGGAIAFDPQGNLWAADIFNHRVLRFPRANLTGSEPAADLVLGQTLFTTNASAPADSSYRTALDMLNQPVAIAIDSSGSVYVSDGLSRVLYYQSPASGGPATRVLGIQPAPAQGQSTPFPPTEYTIGFTYTAQGKVINAAAQCLFTSGTVLFVCDTIAHRILRFNSPNQWPAATVAAPSPAAVAVYGQDSMTGGIANRGQGGFKPSGNTLNSPVAAAFLNNDLWVADAGNNRVLSLPMDPGSFSLGNATRVLGQATFDTYAPNLVEGKEMFVNASSGYHGSAVAIDKSSTPNRVYVADSLNNRILAFSDIRKIGADQWSPQTTQPDFVIGQPDKVKTGPNYPSYDAQLPSDQGLNTPTGVAVDKDGNLWVADTGNGRVLRFPSPFNQTGGGVPRANLVLGQSGFTFTVPDASSNTMKAPNSVVVFNNGDVAAGDLAHNRVLLWQKPGSGDFTNGQSARAVLGQPNFSSTSASGSATGLNAPRGMAVDTGDRLYVADTGNGRVVVYNGTINIASGSSGIVISNLSQPEGVAVSAATGAVWVAASGNSYLYRYAEYSQLGTGPQPLEQLQANIPIAVALDSKDNMIVVEATNRMTFYYGQLIYKNSGNYTSSHNVRNNAGLDSNSNSLTPGLYTILAKSPNAAPFVFTAQSSGTPYPKQLGGIEVLVNGIPSPVVSLIKGTPGDAIYFLVPNSAPSAGNVEILVRDAGTKEVLGAGTFAIGPAAPAFFTTNLAGTMQISAINSDGTLNSASNPAAQGSVLSVWMTGYGHLDGAPDDGVPAGRAFSTDVNPVILVGGYQVPPDKILYSGLSPEYPGAWQINFILPKTGDKLAPVPGPKIPIIVTMRDIPSNVIGVDGGLFLANDRFLPISDPSIQTIAIK